ncbi:RibD family protein [Gracilinema caldarium]|uniref:Riboflavin-specific deaminase domain protein n=1 Tax=Gracilinema caldarium (strain ATCC 51460 / DSM 7334 / H1) TaxID=744872 RepID=F8EZQ9_GRAC1|nr:RibD family protein [Gracilinema caldarium]AEJ20783.1 Riboflavin-specific deaminase domain protein [Gracilinema caldarium DSM 7334]
MSHQDLPPLIPSPLPRLSRPYVVLSWAQSADGQIATRTGDSKYLSSPESLQVQQILRRDCDAVLVGIGTVLADDPRLLCRLSPEANPRNRQPLRVILDARFQTPPEASLCKTTREGPVLIIGAETQPSNNAENEAQRKDEETRIQKLLALGLEVIRVPIEKDSVPSRLKLDLRTVLDRLYQRGIQSLFVEGGSAVLTSFLRANLADRVILDISPRFIGQGIPAVRDLGVLTLPEARRFKTISVEHWGENVVWVMDALS